MQDNYTTWIEAGLEDLQAEANQEGWWPMLLRRKYAPMGITNRAQWEALRDR